LTVRVPDVFGLMVPGRPICKVPRTLTHGRNLFLSFFPLWVVRRSRAGSAASDFGGCSSFLPCLSALGGRTWFSSVLVDLSGWLADFYRRRHAFFCRPTRGGLGVSLSCFSKDTPAPVSPPVTGPSVRQFLGPFFFSSFYQQTRAKGAPSPPCTTVSDPIPPLYTPLGWAGSTPASDFLCSRLFFFFYPSFNQL